ncbi:lipoprotein [Pseudomonas sp. Os17]|nr:lipoprotein [Pseudomonas sp. Os17]
MQFVGGGGSGIEIACSGLGVGWSKCYERAELECRADGYKVITKSRDSMDEEGNYPFGWNPAGHLTRTMLVVCR